MFCQRKTEYPTVMPFYGISTYGMLRKNFRIDELQCCSDVEVLVCKAVKNVQVLEAEKKLAWTDLDRVNFEKNFFKESTFKSKNWLGQV
jgi:hypothetical protein